MKTTITTKTAGKITINSTYIGDKAATWANDNYNNHKVTVRCAGKSLTFDFWGSMMNPELRSNQDNISALECFMSDSSFGQESFEYFCNELGYDTDSRKAEKSYKSCVSSFKKFNRVFNCDHYDLADEIRNLANK